MCTFRRPNLLIAVTSLKLSKTHILKHTDRLSLLSHRSPPDHFRTHRSSLTNALMEYLLGALALWTNWSIFTGVAESRYEWQPCTHPKVSLDLGFKNPTKEDSYLKSATPNFLQFLSPWRCVALSVANYWLYGKFPYITPKSVLARLAHIAL